MAKKGLVAGGTRGATELSEVYSQQYRFPDEERSRLLAVCPPCDAWLKQFRDGLVDLVDSPEIAIIMAIEACGNRYLRSTIKPATVPHQREYLKALETHASALVDLLAGFPTMDGTTADFFKFLHDAATKHGVEPADTEHRMATYNMLVTLKTFARFRLQTDLKPIVGEEHEQKVKRKNTYGRFVLGADLLAAWARITGREPTATASNDDGVRRVSMAVDFLGVALPPILREARMEKDNRGIVDDQTLRKMISEIKEFWRDGIRPELAYVAPNWGSRRIG